MFASISAHSPPLDYFPASQRVTYLYYLGRYLFSNNLFHPAGIALQAAYDQCHRQAIKQKGQILVYLIARNIIMGRFPSPMLFQTPEAQGLAERFLPLCRIIISGDYLAFREHLAVDSASAEWFARKGILFQLRHRCEILVWRSLTRKVFIYGGFHGEQNPQTQRGPPPFLYLSKLEAAVRFLQTRHSQPTFLKSSATDADSKNGHGSATVHLPPDNDFQGLNGFITRSSDDADIDDYIAPDGYFDADGEWRENADGLPVDGEPEENGDNLEELNPYDAINGDVDLSGEQPPALLRELESVLASLLTQGLMRGYLTHKNPRFAIPGARLRGALPTGFPNVWQTIHTREVERGEEVPGWVRRPSVSRSGQRSALGGTPFQGAGGGRVVNLKGAKPVGVQ
jgi:hypothetical protein